jgi:hypothetical protein
MTQHDNHLSDQQQIVDQEQLIEHIAATLGESQPEPVAQIRRIVQHLGESYAREMLAETLSIEEQGGMLVKSGRRRRTPGGIFFWLVRQRLVEEGHEEELQEIFPAAFVPAGSAPAAQPPTIAQPVRPRKKRAGYHRPRQRTTVVNRAEALERIMQPRPDQATILAAIDRWLGNPPDLYRRSVNPDTGAVMLFFHFPDVVLQHYREPLAASAEAAGVPISIAPHPHQGALMDAAREALPAELQLLRTPSLRFEQHTVRAICAGTASEQDLAEAQQQFQEKTGWSLDVDIRAEHAEHPAEKAAEGAQQQHAAQMVQDILKDACYKVSVHTTTQTLTARCFFPDIVRATYAAPLRDLEQQIGWTIAIHPETHQGALREMIQELLPTSVELIRPPSLYREERQIIVSYRGKLTEKQHTELVATISRQTGWQLLLMAAD